MQTFLPYADFDASAVVLDRQRLGKQRVETMQIMSALIENRGWIHHPVTKMWKGYEGALYLYQEAIVREWRSRGYKDTCLDKTHEIFLLSDAEITEEMPWWLGDIKFHESHQSNLVRKLPQHYRRYFPDIPDNLPYYYPTKD